MAARNNSKSVTFFKSVSQFDNVLRVSQMLIKEETPSSIIYRRLVSVLPSLPGCGFRIPVPVPDFGFRLFHAPFCNTHFLGQKIPKTQICFIASTVV